MILETPQSDMIFLAHDSVYVSAPRIFDRDRIFPDLFSLFFPGRNILCDMRTSFLRIMHGLTFYRQGVEK